MRYSRAVILLVWKLYPAIQPLPSLARGKNLVVTSVPHKVDQVPGPSSRLASSPPSPPPHTDSQNSVWHLSPPLHIKCTQDSPTNAFSMLYGVHQMCLFCFFTFLFFYCENQKRNDCCDKKNIISWKSSRGWWSFSSSLAFLKSKALCKVYISNLVFRAHSAY